MKTLNVKKIIFILSLGAFSLLAACGDASNSKRTTKPAAPGTYSNPTECQNQRLQIGVPGNVDCPFQGAYDPQLGYQGAAIFAKAGFNINFSFNFGIGYKVDFGWDYKDLCDYPGQLPIFENGNFSRCEYVNPTYAKTDYQGFTLPNTGECTGDQYNADITGCRPRIGAPSIGSPYPR